MHILWTLFIGLIVGLVARALHPGEDRMGIIMTSLLGIGGSFLATYAGHELHLYRAGQSAGFIGATIGAIVLLVLGNVLRRSFR